jgi:uncharacterized protein
MTRLAGDVAEPADAPLHKRFQSAVGAHLLLVPHSRIYDVAGLSSEDEAEFAALAQSLARLPAAETPMAAVPAPAPQSLSLNVSASCNLACAYCYAAQGGFAGAQPKPMAWAVAREAIDRLLARADPQAPITLGFLGGEPFVNRRLIHQAVAYAAAEGARRGLDVRFSVTTNGSLLEAEDRDLLRAHPFAVTVSIDGDAATQARQRPPAKGQGDGHGQLQAAVAPLLERPGRARINARATVTRQSLDLARAFDAIAALGFDDIGFAPLKSGPEKAGVLQADDWPAYLRHLTALARRELQGALRGEPVRLANFAVALKQLHRGASSPYPCGAGGGYFSVAANGDWYTCHRAIGDEAFRVGDSGHFDETKRLAFLRQRHVHAQSACRACWARYLCSGSCHQEADLRTDSFCGFVRGWLEFCLAAYCELSTLRPPFFAAASPTPVTEEELP